MDHNAHTGHDDSLHSSCCASSKPLYVQHQEIHGKGHSALMTASHATFHCLTGCVIGETTGLIIGVSAGLSAWATMGLATILAFFVGFALAIFPLMKRTSLDFYGALKAIWLGEVISIAVMEIVMNTVDYHMGGVQAATVISWQFWQGILIAVPAGYLAALPVNFWLIGRQLKRCH